MSGRDLLRSALAVFKRRGDLERASEVRATLAMHKRECPNCGEWETIVWRDGKYECPLCLKRFL